MKLTIEQAKQKKLELETKVFKLLCEFESETGMKVLSVNTDVYLGTDQDGSLLTGILIDVKL